MTNAIGDSVAPVISFGHHGSVGILFRSGFRQVANFDRDVGKFRPQLLGIRRGDKRREQDDSLPLTGAVRFGQRHKQRLSQLIDVASADATNQNPTDCVFSVVTNGMDLSHWTLRFSNVTH